MTLGERLSAARRAKDMTQDALADAIHVSRTTISSWERDRTQPDLEMLRRLEALLDADLLTKPDIPAPPQDAEFSSGPDVPAAPQGDPATTTAEPMSSKPSRALNGHALRRRWWLVPAVLLVGLLVAVLLLRFASGSRFPVADYRRETPNVAGQAYVEYETSKQEMTSGDNVYSLYEFKLCERNGVGFDIASTEITMEGKSGKLRVMTQTPEELQAAGIATRVEPYGVTAITGGWPKGEFRRVGIAAHILDDAGAAQTYYSMIEF